MPQPTKAELVAEIRRLNPTAPERFLSDFTPGHLGEYLAHLQVIKQRGDRLRGWVNARTPSNPRPLRRAA